LSHPASLDALQANALIKHKKRSILLENAMTMPIPGPT